MLGQLIRFCVSIAVAKCILATAACVSVCLPVCLSVLTAFAHYSTDPNVTWGMRGVPPSCAISGVFAVDARVWLL